jgi:DNA-binding winged helix-turn-helix (wHTH) protein
VRLLFGECEFDSGRRLLLRHGSATPLSPKAFQFLEFLLDKRPEVVPKTELIEHLWPQTFVSDASLHNLVAEVRAALGDDPRAARYIRTVPRYGYAFHGDVRPAPPADLELSGLARSGPRLLSRRREWVLSEGSNVVGRDRDCGVRIDSAAVSRRHARIVVTSGHATTEDLGSKNGTYVNGQRVEQPVAIEDGDQIRIGSVTMTYRIGDALPATMTQAANPSRSS